MAKQHIDVDVAMLLDDILHPYGICICNGKLESDFQHFTRCNYGFHFKCIANNGVCKCHMRRVGLWAYYAVKNDDALLYAVCNTIDAFQIPTTIHYEDDIAKGIWVETSIISNPCFKCSLEELCIKRDLQKNACL